MKYPKEIMEDVYWSFNQEMEEGLESFSQHLVGYNKELEIEVAPAETVLQVREIWVRFYKDGEEEEDDDEEDDDEDDYDEEEDEEDGRDDDEEDEERYDAAGYTDFLIRSDSGSHLTIGEILFTIHKNVAPVLQSSDFHFFEGLRLRKQQTDPAVPLYVLMLGS